MVLKDRQGLVVAPNNSLPMQQPVVGAQPAVQLYTTGYNSNLPPNF